MNKRHFVGMAAMAVAMTSFAASGAFAHGVWLANRLDKIQLVLGEGFKDNAYDPKMVTRTEGYDADFNSSPVTVRELTDHVVMEPDAKTSVVVVNFDYGYWSNNSDGKFVNKPMDEVEGSTIGTHALKYSVNYLKAVNSVKAIADLPLQIVPAQDPTKLKVGDPLTVQVLKDGKPLPDAEIIPDVINHHTVTVKTDGDGKATVAVANGSTNVIGIEMAFPYAEKNPRATQDKIFAALSFTIYPPEED